MTFSQITPYQVCRRYKTKGKDLKKKISPGDFREISSNDKPPDAEILPRRGTRGVTLALIRSFIFSISSHLEGGQVRYKASTWQGPPYARMTTNKRVHTDQHGTTDGAGKHEERRLCKFDLPDPSFWHTRVHGILQRKDLRRLSA